mgnify:CR=1 FL=1
MFENKNIIITGASSGIGRSIAVTLSSLGANCILLARNKERLEETQRMCVNPSEVFPIDLANFKEYDKLFEDIVKKCGKIAGFVHSAGIEQTIPLKLLTAEKLRAIFDINVYSAIESIRRISSKKYRDSDLSLVLISSVMGVVGNKGLTSYSASKGAIISMAKSMALELASKNIRVNVVSPGHIKDSEMSIQKELNLPDESVERIAQAHPIGMGKCEDVSHLVSFLLSDKSKWITGQNYIIDGGYSIQ